MKTPEFKQMIGNYRDKINISNRSKVIKIACIRNDKRSAKAKEMKRILNEQF